PAARPLSCEGRESCLGAWNETSVACNCCSCQATDPFLDMRLLLPRCSRSCTAGSLARLEAIEAFLCAEIQGPVDNGIRGQRRLVHLVLCDRLEALAGLDHNARPFLALEEDLAVGVQR